MMKIFCLKRQDALTNSHFSEKLTQRNECSQDQSIHWLLFTKNILLIDQPYTLLLYFCEILCVRFNKISVFKYEDLNKGIEFTGHVIHTQASDSRKLSMLSGDSTSNNMRSLTGILLHFNYYGQQDKRKVTFVRFS